MTTVDRLAPSLVGHGRFGYRGLASVPLRSHLLHEEYLRRVPVVGSYMVTALSDQVERLAADVTSTCRPSPSVSVVIRSRNNIAGLSALLDDIDCQVFSGDIEVIVVDSESSDGSTELARRRGATIVPICQADYSHPYALNAGFRAASHQWVFSLVEHSSLSHNLTLQTAVRWDATAGVAGFSGVSMPGQTATLTEQVASIPVVASVILRPPHEVRRDAMGVLATNCAAIRREAWQELGYFDERFGGGGEDGAFCRAALAAGWKVGVDAAMSLFHSHGLGPVNSVRQLWHWAHMGRPQDFSLERLISYRTDLQRRATSL